MFSIKQESMEILLFIYGLSFFVLGISVLFSRSRDSEYFFANKIWLLGVFAISHAFEDWISLFEYIHPKVKFPLLDYIQSFLLLVSYIFLFEFSRFVIRKSFLKSKHKNKLREHIIYKLYYPPAIYTLISIGLLFLIYLHPTISGINAAIRYTYGFWGAFLLGGGLYHYGDSLKKNQNTNTLKLYFKISGAAFAAYALFSGIVVDPISYFPGNIINTETFINIFHFPVQALRGLCALVIAAASIKTLGIFRYELVTKLNESYENIKRFSSNASHQIKTPLTALRLQIHLALKKNKNVQEYRDSLRAIDSEIVYLQDMVSNLLLLTRIQNMNIRENFQFVELDGIVLEIFEEYSVIAKNKGVVLDIKNLDYIQIKAEPTLLRILITNLIDNAIKYTPQGKKITISLIKSVFLISDEGIGIPQDKIPMIYDEFYRVNAPGKTHIKGYGLGLSMVKKIIEIHKAKIRINSKVDKGTSISVKFN
ncbi:MAG: HAMP domain-containing histidine kinase [Epsilonproteobacteria bacterium]|nr:HAMP domain-containing histidine kinase [Campylobacterota bacterium]